MIALLIVSPALVFVAFLAWHALTPERSEYLTTNHHGDDHA